MLSAFTARPIIELRPRDKSKIETILAYGDRLLVGLNTGALCVYRVNNLHPSSDPSNGSLQPHEPVAPSQANAADQAATPAPAPKPTDLLREVERFSTRAIEQLAIIKEANTLVSLSNYQVSIHDLQTFDLIETLGGTRNATCFAVTSNVVEDAATGIPEIISRLAVAVKRRLLLWSWHESELSSEIGEVMLPEAIRSVTWATATQVIIGMTSGYVLVNVETNAMDEIDGPTGTQGRFGAVSSSGMGYMGLGGYTPKPLAAKLGHGEILLAKDVNTLFIDAQGKPLDKMQIPWVSAPESIGYSYPYILALQSPAKGSLEIRNPDTLSLLQTISLPGAAQIHFPPPTVSLAHAGKGFHVSSDRCVWKMDATDYDSQINKLVEKGKYDEAISILNMLEDALLKDKAESIREVKCLKAELLFREKKFRESMDLFNEDEVRATPERVLKLFPVSIAGNLSAEFATAAEESDEEVASEQEPTTEEQNGKAESTHETEEPSPVQKTAGGWGSMFIRGRAASETASVHTPNKPAVEEEEPNGANGKPGRGDALDGKDLVNAVLELNSYLAGTRARLQRVIDPVTGRLKPRPERNKTAEDAMKSFLASAHDESERDLEEKLRETFKLVDTTLFRSYMFSRPALAGSLFRIPNFCDPAVVNEKLLEHNRYNELVDFFYGKKLHVEALELLKRFGAAEFPDKDAPTLHGPQRTVAYLQGLQPSHIDLILQYAEWTLRANPELGMEIFITDSENAETLPRDRVAKFLGDIDTNLEVQYLEHIIDELNDLNPYFHNQLVGLYVDYLKAEGRNDTWDNVMERFVKFLGSSRQYSLSRAFTLIPRDDPSFYEAQAIVLSLMGNHKQALEIYVFKMKDYAKAEEYCNRVHKTDSNLTSPAQSQRVPDEDARGSSPSIYHTLLSLYLTPPPPHSTCLAPALDLLSKHGSRLPAASTLSLIPDDLPVRELESYFRGRMRAATSLVNESRIVAGLRAAELISSQARLLLGDDVAGVPGGRNRRVIITDEKLCGVCHKRLGGSVISVLSDNSVVHYGCANRVGAHRPEGTRAASWARSG